MKKSIFSKVVGLNSFTVIFQGFCQLYRNTYLKEHLLTPVSVFLILTIFFHPTERFLQGFQFFTFPINSKFKLCKILSTIYCFYPKLFVCLQEIAKFTCNGALHSPHVLNFMLRLKHFLSQ